tara:strand:- start:593 stop:823 length:231 start_codon:yes stop_codon:yes gene_type:complete
MTGQPDNRKPNHLADWGTGKGRIHIVGKNTGRCVGCKKQATRWYENQQDMTVSEVKATDFGLCSFVSNFWLDRMTE